MLGFLHPDLTSCEKSIYILSCWLLLIWIYAWADLGVCRGAAADPFPMKVCIIFKEFRLRKIELVSVLASPLWTLSEFSGVIC